MCGFVPFGASWALLPSSRGIRFLTAMALASASTQTDFGKPDCSSVLGTDSMSVLFIRSATPLYCGVYGAERVTAMTACFAYFSTGGYSPHLLELKHFMVHLNCFSNTTLNYLKLSSTIYVVLIGVAVTNLVNTSKNVTK
jgi:hypothetical protein